MTQLSFDFPFPVLPIREFLDLKHEIARQERDVRSDIELPEWLLHRKAQFKEVCAARGHQNGRPWDNGLGWSFVDCARCGTRISSRNYLEE